MYVIQEPMCSEVDDPITRDVVAGDGRTAGVKIKRLQALSLRRQRHNGFGLPAAKRQPLERLKTRFPRFAFRIISCLGPFVRVTRSWMLGFVAPLLNELYPRILFLKHRISKHGYHAVHRSAVRHSRSKNLHYRG